MAPELTPFLLGPLPEEEDASPLTMGEGVVE